MTFTPKIDIDIVAGAPSVRAGFVVTGSRYDESNPTHVLGPWRPIGEIRQLDENRTDIRDVNWIIKGDHRALLNKFCDEYLKAHS